MILPIAAFLSVARFEPTASREQGLATMDRIQKELLMPGGLAYGESAGPGKEPTAVAFNWSAGVMLSALSAAARADSARRGKLTAYVASTRAYWSGAPPVPGFDALPPPRSPDRYYDDNEWMVLALLDANETLKSPAVLERAKAAYRFVMSGEDPKLGGGIYWREAHKTSKNTCSNGPAAACALALYRATKDVNYIADAERIYAWTRSILRDSVDGLYWDNIKLDGKIEKTKWSYNSGLMLRAAAELFAATKKEAYADDAREIQASSLSRWVRVDGALRDEGKFMHLLLENWLRAFSLVLGVKDPRPTIQRGLDWLLANGADSLGHFGGRWDRPAPKSPLSSFNLIDQASVARALLVASLEMPDHK
ncbi:MAG TPA: glycoside hydrolase family 76 protein [Fimbriimonadaceae bacterium]|nr:glycoside hydrolase family 76 protein [Fimbriimonadaceae bacterium]